MSYLLLRVCLHIVVSNTYYVVFYLFVFALCIVLNVASVSGLSILDFLRLFSLTIM
jgi:hypothetical protein